MPRTVNGMRPVVAVDIDGTLGAYHEHFLEFAEGWLGRTMPKVDTFEGGSLSRHMRVSKDTYRQVKLAFRQGGLKRSMPVYPHARELTIDLRKQGAEVWVCTTRPYLRLDNIDPDTRHWLRRNGIQYDGVIFGEGKYKRLAQIVGQAAIVAVLDDLPEQIVASYRLGLPTLLNDQPYNRPPAMWGEDHPPGAYLRVRGLEEAAAEIGGMLDDWKERQ